MSPTADRSGAPPEVKVWPGARQLWRAAADEFARAARQAVAARGRFTVALAGGTTPRGAYSLLAEDDARQPAQRLPWDKVHLFFGDERHVPPDHSDSNYRMVREALLSRIVLPESNIHRMEGELPAQEAADSYQHLLQDFFALPAGEWPRFDLVLLGMGPDGHTASLFPGSQALAERKRLVAANWVEKFASFRLTLTFPVLNHAAEVLFLVTGADKAGMLKSVLEGDSSAVACPAQRVRPTAGRLLWYTDQAAAAQLSRSPAGD
jgi:6-phosphogluconolactonase